MSQLLPTLGPQMGPHLELLYSNGITNSTARTNSTACIREYEALVWVLTGKRVRNTQTEVWASGMSHLDESHRPLLDATYHLCHPSRPNAERDAEVRVFIDHLRSLSQRRGEAIMSHTQQQDYEAQMATDVDMLLTKPALQRAISTDL